jgi:carnitine O-acetyltransferase
MANISKTIEEKTNLLKDAINAHRAFTVDVINGQSFDRHLLGLRLIALENKLELPEIYKDIGFTKACHYYLSTSQVSSKFDAVAGYGPLVNDGYGACYSIMEDRIHFGLSAFNSCPETNVNKFARYLQEALLDCQSLLNSKPKSKL